MQALQPNPAPRAPVRYKGPRSSWVVVAVLGLAGIGIFALAYLFVPRLKAWVDGGARPGAVLPHKPVVYRELARDDAVLVTVEVSPRSARLLLDGDPLPSNPVRLPRDGALHRLSALADGHEPAELPFVADKVKTVKIKLKKQ